MSFLDADGQTNGTAEVAYLNGNPQIGILSIEMEYADGITRKLEKTFDEYKTIESLTSMSKANTDAAYGYSYKWRQDSSNRPTIGFCDEEKLEFFYTYDDNGCIKRLDYQNEDSGDYGFYEPSYTFVEHPSMWAYICSRMYDIDTYIY